MSSKREQISYNFFSFSLLFHHISLSELLKRLVSKKEELRGKRKAEEEGGMRRREKKDGAIENPRSRLSQVGGHLL